MTTPIPPFIQEQFDRDPTADPLEDPRTVAWLEEHPEALESFAALRATVGPSTSSTTRPRPLEIHRPRLVASIAVVATGLASAVAALLIWSTQPGPESSGTPPGPQSVATRPPLPRPNFATRSRVVACSTSATVDDSERRFRRVERAGYMTYERTTSLQIQASPTPDVLRCVSSITHHQVIRP